MNHRPAPRNLTVVPILTLLGLCLSGCIAYSGARRPNLVASRAKPSLAATPRIEVVLHHVHTMEGKDAGGMATDLTYKEMKESFERVRKETPFLANAGIGTTKPDFVLDLETEVAEHGKTSAIVSGATLFLVPGFPHSDVIARGTLKNADGETIGHYEASGEAKFIFHLLFLPLLPIVPFTAPGKELYDDTFRDLVLQLAPDLEKHVAAQ